MKNREYSDRHIGLTDNEPLLNATCYESADGELVQFLVTVRNNKSAAKYGQLTPRGIIRKAIIDAARANGIKCAHAGGPRDAHLAKEKRG